MTVTNQKKQSKTPVAAPNNTWASSNRKTTATTTLFLIFLIKFLLCPTKLLNFQAQTNPPTTKTTTCANAPLPLCLYVNKTGSNCVFESPTEMEEKLKLKYSSVNCNSLNISCPSKNTWKKKVFAIAQLKSDIILLSDIRLSSKSKSTGIKSLRNYFLTNPYKSYNFYYNSTMNKRGVGILISKSLPLSETNRYSDNEENILGLRLQDTTGNTITVISIYGPNKTDEQFFINLNSAITRLGNNQLVIGGDWNCTFSTENLQNNIDWTNMLETPNPRHSQLLNEFCNRHNLSDPFRYLWPNRKDYSYVPSNKNQLNRSRLDFFLVPVNSLPNVQKCDIDYTTLSKRFDQKAVHVNYRKTFIKKIVPQKYPEQ